MRSRPATPPDHRPRHQQPTPPPTTPPTHARRPTGGVNPTAAEGEHSSWFGVVAPAVRGITPSSLTSNFGNLVSNTPDEQGATMTIITAPQQYNEEQLYVDLNPVIGHSLYLKCEGFNFA